MSVRVKAWDPEALMRRTDGCPHWSRWEFIFWGISWVLRGQMMSTHMWESILMSLGLQYKCHPPLGKSAKLDPELGCLAIIDPSHMDMPANTCHTCLVVNVDSYLNKSYSHTLGSLWNHLWGISHLGLLTGDAEPMWSAPSSRGPGEGSWRETLSACWLCPPCWLGSSSLLLLLFATILKLQPSSVAFQHGSCTSGSPAVFQTSSSITVGLLRHPDLGTG